MSWLGRLLGKGGKDDGAMAWRPFVEEYAARIEQGLGATVTPEWGASPDLTTLRIHLPDGGVLNAIPGNLWRACCQAPQQRETLIDNMLETLRAAATEQQQSSGLAPVRVLPVIRNGAWAEGQRQLMARAIAQEPGAVEEELLYLPGPGELIIAFVEDKPDRMRTLYSSALAQLGMPDVAALYDTAVKNLFGRPRSATWRRACSGCIWTAITIPACSSWRATRCRSSACPARQRSACRPTASACCAVPTTKPPSMRCEAKLRCATQGRTSRCRRRSTSIAMAGWCCRRRLVGDVSATLVCWHFATRHRIDID